MANVHSLKVRSAPEELDAAFRRAIRALKGSSVQINKATVAKRAASYVHETASVLENKLNNMDEAALKDLGFSDETAPLQSAGSGTKLLTSLHWRGRKQTRPLSRR